MEAPKKSAEDRAVRGRLIYINHRLAEIKEETERLKKERHVIRGKSDASESAVPGKRV